MTIFLFFTGYNFIVIENLKINLLKLLSIDYHLHILHDNCQLRLEKLGVEPRKIMCKIIVLPNYTISPFSFFNTLYFFPL